MFVDIFNSPHSRVVMRSGRQVSKTVTLAADIITTAVSNPYLPMLYTNASGKQTTTFSTSKLDPLLYQSPVVYHNFMKGKYVINNVYNKRLLNYSEIRLSYFSESADRVRGTTSFKTYFDEVQDVLYDAVIDTEECSSAAPEPKFMYAGTSKSMITTLEFFWQLSTQKCWIIPCEGCKKWNIPSIENIAKEGLVCKKCGKLINTFSGMWKSFAETEKTEKEMFDGYHIPQIIMPMHCTSEEKWSILYEKFKKYPRYKFLNEVMGLPLGEGDTPVTKELLQSICIPDLKIATRLDEVCAPEVGFVVAGCDWGGGGMDGTSRTVLSIYGVYPESPRYRKIFGKIFEGGDPSKHLDEIAYTLRVFNVLNFFGDFGGGNFAMAQLARLVPGIKIVPVMYSEQSAPFRWDAPSAKYIVNRTMMIDQFILDMKAGYIETFRWEEFEPFALDILNVKEDMIGEDRGKGRRVWRRYPSKSDDALHSMVFGWFGARMLAGQTNFTAVS